MRNFVNAPIEDHTSFISTTSGMSGFFAVMYWWNKDLGGFWEPWATGFGRYATQEEAIVEAQQWAIDEELEYKP